MSKDVEPGLAHQIDGDLRDCLGLGVDEIRRNPRERHVRAIGEVRAIELQVDRPRHVRFRKNTRQPHVEENRAGLLSGSDLSGCHTTAFRDRVNDDGFLRAHAADQVRGLAEGLGTGIV